jgi:hypothetical protein
MILEQNLLSTTEQLAIYDATMIPRLSFGHDLVLGMHRGQYLKCKRKRAFVLHCGHIITSRTDIAGFCSCCQALAAQTDVLHAQWMSVVCVTCFRRCDAPFCAAGLCPVHAGRAEDGKWYCPLHFEELEQQVSLEEIRQQHGAVASKSVGFFRSLMFDDKKLVE